MNRSAVPAHPKLGAFIWESPAMRPSPKLLLIIFGIAFIGMAVALSTVAVPLLLNGRTAVELNGGIIGVGLVAVLLIPGMLMISRAVWPALNPGFYFFERGVEYGAAKKRQAMSYRDLVDIHFDYVDHDAEASGAAARLMISALAGNAVGVGHALGKMQAGKTIESIAVIKPSHDEEFKVPILDSMTKRLASIAASARNGI